MNNRRLLVLLLAMGIGAAACGSSSGASPSLPAMTLFETSVRPFEVVDFDAVHQPVDADGNASLIFGALPVTPAATGVAPELAAFLGRWEGYGRPAPRCHRGGAAARRRDAGIPDLVSRGLAR